MIRHGLAVLSSLGLLFGNGLQAGEIPEVAPTVAYANVSAGSGILVDVRTPDEWRETGVPVGALRVNFQGPDFVPMVKRIVEIHPDKTVYLICRSGRRSLAAAAQLRQAGIDKAVSVESGVAGGHGWSAARLPLENCRNCPPWAP